MTLRRFDTDAERAAYRHGLQDEAALAKAKRDALPWYTRQLLNYIDALTDVDPTLTVGKLLAGALYVFRSTITRDQLRAIRRATRGRMP